MEVDASRWKWVVEVEGSRASRWKSVEVMEVESSNGSFHDSTTSFTGSQWKSW